MGSPYSYWPLQLMGCVLYLHGFSDSQQAKLLLNGIQPLVCLERFFCLFKDRRLSVQKILEGAILVWFRPLVLLVGMSVILRSVSSIALWFPKNCAKKSFTEGGRGGGRSPSSPPFWLVLALACVRGIYKIATISDYWMMSRDCRRIVSSCQTDITGENLKFIQ